MAEVQTSTVSGEMTQRFIEFVMMHAQNAALFLGQIPNPQGDQPEVNLEVAKMFIDQLAMIQEKTRGNLSNEESAVLRNALSNLQLAYVEVAQGKGMTMPPQTEQEQKTEAPAPTGQPTEKVETSAAPEPQSPSAEGDSRKKFTKSYGS